MSTSQGVAAGHGLVLVRGVHKASARWLRRGLVAVDVVELPGWTAVCLAEDTARSAPPYDKGLEVLAARPVPGRRRPSVGLFVIDGCAVVTVQQRGWRADQRWLVWEPGSGVRRTPELPALPAAAIVEAAGARQRATAAEVSEHFRDPTGEPVDVLTGLMRLLGLPGEELLTAGGGGRGARILPSSRNVAAFDRLVSDEADDDDEDAGVGAAVAKDVSEETDGALGVDLPAGRRREEGPAAGRGGRPR